MTMIEDNAEYEKKTVQCKNCENFISFYFKPKGQPLIGNWFCNLLCIDRYEKKQKKLKENLTEKTLS